jgi:hypothetical protein
VPKVASFIDDKGYSGCLLHGNHHSPRAMTMIVYPKKHKNKPSTTTPTPMTPRSDDVDGRTGDVGGRDDAIGGNWLRSRVRVESGNTEDYHNDGSSGSSGFQGSRASDDQGGMQNRVEEIQVGIVLDVQVEAH